MFLSTTNKKMNNYINLNLDNIEEEHKRLLASARSEGRDDALKSCTYTGIAYFLTVVALILPYLLISHPLIALGVMIGIIVLNFPA